MLEEYNLNSSKKQKNNEKGRRKIDNNRYIPWPSQNKERSEFRIGK